MSWQATSAEILEGATGSLASQDAATTSTAPNALHPCTATSPRLGRRTPVLPLSSEVPARPFQRVLERPPTLCAPPSIESQSNEVYSKHGMPLIQTVADDRPMPPRVEMGT